MKDGKLYWVTQNTPLDVRGIEVSKYLMERMKDRELWAVIVTAYTWGKIEGKQNERRKKK